MSGAYIFPYDIIPKDSKVVMYGAGRYGKWVYLKNSKNKWCNICCIIDSNWMQKKDFPVEVNSKEKLDEIHNYDYVYISILNDNIRNSIKEFLIKKGVTLEKILEPLNSTIYHDQYMEINTSDVDDDGGTIIKIGYSIGPSIGDQIIALKVYQELVKLCSDVEIKIFCRNTEVAKVIYWKQACLSEIVGYYPGEEEISDFDIFISAEFIPCLRSFHRLKVMRISRRLYTEINKIYIYQKEQSPGNAVPVYESRILLDRAAFYNKNRFTLLGISGAFEINDSNVSINVVEDKIFSNEVQDYGDYITIHYGASDVMNNGVVQTKVWPFDYCERLCELIKKEFPNIKIVQLGDSNDPIIRGTDIQLMGEVLQKVEIVLKNAIVHIDCESGLAHLATQLKTKCIVMFGPTPIWFFGYPQNYNIAPRVCGGCKGLLRDWYTHCIKNIDGACMKSITPDIVYKVLKQFLEQK
ncbi:MAG: glycosyltransferase family 9 protein [Pseudobutyrivibrio sp.]|uniref:glycosyltransferase family 9 protein n=1 Tax=Pseudobutyrivibrio sp. TaxID=2014367 RepID=UPI0025EDD829|nr:hypothetical protein [Pseudobutyrivibrio sp.]MBQ6463051.1 glycosyltransferase family 9 protein [Pseudobutyrivibrio sp.]